MQKNLEMLLSLIKNDYSISEISNILNVPYNKIYEYLYKLKDEGYEILRKYYSNGNMRFIVSNQLYEDYTPVILTEENENKIEMLVYSDLHLGSIFEKSKYLKMVYDYSKQKNIHIHLNAGDLVEGVIVESNIKIPFNEQIKHALKVYPHSDDILVFLLLGNHDYSLLEGHGINISEIIKNKRGDVIPIGFKEGKIKIKNDVIVMLHPVMNTDLGKRGIYNHNLIIRGHGHEAQEVIDSSNLYIYTPALCDLNLKNSTHPGFTHLTLKMRYGFIENVKINELIIIGNKISVVNGIEVFVGHGKKIRESNIILNEEENPKILKRRKNEKYL